MSNRYFIWEEAKCQEINSKWVEISGREFYSLLKESSKKRYFEKIDEYMVELRIRGKSCANEKQELEKKIMNLTGGTVNG